jgi:flagellar hook-length control protein FliK
MNPVVPVSDVSAPSQASARAAARTAPHELFAALLELLGALPLPSNAAGSAPQASAQSASAQEGLPARQEAETANALFATAAAASADGGRPPTPAPVPASDSDAAVPSGSALPGAPALAAPRLAAAPTPGPQPDAPAHGDVTAPAAGALPAHTPAPPHEAALELAAASGPRATRESVPALAPRTAQAQPAQKAVVPLPPALERAATRHEARVRNPGALAAALPSSPLAGGAAQPRSPELALEPVPLDDPSAEVRTAASLAGERPVPSAPTNPLEAPARARSAESAQPVLASALWLAEQDGGRARIALSPRELGQVEIVVRVRGRRVEVHVRAEESAAQQVVRETRAQLSDALAARDLRMEEFTVNGGGSGASGGDSRESARDGGGQRAAALERPLGDGRALAAPGTPHGEPALPGGAIDLRV